MEVSANITKSSERLITTFLKEIFIEGYNHLLNLRNISYPLSTAVLNFMNKVQFPSNNSDSMKILGVSIPKFHPSATELLKPQTLLGTEYYVILPRAQLEELEFLSLGRNNFHGSLPLQICYLSSIQLLDLSQNNLAGQIPKCIKNFSSMAQMTSRDYQLRWYFIDNSHNLYYSYYLKSFLMWKGSQQKFQNNELSLLKSIDLSSNHFSEEIPIEIESLFGLVSLNLSRNHLTGNILSNIGKLTSLDFLDLSRNQLVGSIPSSLTQIDRLSVLDLSHNNLSGEIPTGTQLQSFNASCFEDNLDLCGPPLEKLCIDGKPAQEPIVKLPEDEKLLFTREFYMRMTIGFVISFWGVFGSILIKRSWRHAYFKFISNLSDAIYVMAAVKVFKWRHRG